MKKKFNKDQSNVVKGVAVLLLLFHHLFLHKDYIDEVGLLYPVTLYYKFVPVINISRICVWIFAFISAYGLSTKYYNEYKKHGQRYSIAFVLSHWLKLMWKWWIAMVAMIIIYRIRGGSVAELYDFNIWLFLLDVLEWNDFFGYPRVLGNWYLCFAQILIVMIPVLNIVCDKLGVLTIPIAYLGMQYLSDGIISTGGGAYSGYFLTVIAGVCLAKDSLGLLNCRKHKITQAIEMILLLMFSSSLLIIQYKLPTDERQISMILRMLAVVFIVIFIVKYINGLPARILGFLGKHSTEMFMSNVFFLTYTKRVVSWSSNPFIAYISLAVVTVLFSVCIQLLASKAKYNILLKNIIIALEKRMEIKND